MERLIITAKEIKKKVNENIKGKSIEFNNKNNLMAVHEDDYYYLGCRDKDVAVALYTNEKPPQIVVIDGNVGNKIEDVKKERIKEIAEILGF